MSVATIEAERLTPRRGLCIALLASIRTGAAMKPEV